MAETMNGPEFERLENRVRTAAQHFEYPPTPPLVAVVSARLRGQESMARPPYRRAWATNPVLAALVLAVLLLGAMSVPSVRAAVIEFIQIGVVRILRGAPSDPLPPQAPTAQPAVQMPLTATPAALIPVTATPAASLLPTPGYLIAPERLSGEVTLEDARQAVDFPVRLPSFPPDLGEPDRVYLQDMDGDLLILVWSYPGHPESIWLSLHTIEPGSWALEKVRPQVVEETTVNGRPAVWTVGPYMLIMRSGDNDIGRLIDGNVLIWEQDGLTYRLETNLPMEEAVKIAESIK